MNDEKKEQREAAAQRSACVCKTPLVKHVDGGVFICATCGKGLLVDGEGKPYRRLRGDLDTPEQRMGRDTLEAAQKAKDEMMELVVQLPEKQKRYLLQLSKLKPHRFQKEARRMIRTHLAMKETEAKGGVTIGPNARRRLQREMANAVDAINPSHVVGSIGEKSDVTVTIIDDGKGEPLVIAHAGAEEEVPKIPPEHAQHCGICDTDYDRRELDQVIFHDGGHQLAEATGIIGERTDEQPHVHRCEDPDGEECAERGFCKCACGACISLYALDETGWEGVHPREPVNCPVDDPACEGADGECHDACERPEPDAAQIARDAASRHAIDQATARATAGNEFPAKCHLCGFQMHDADDRTMFHGLGNCVEICEKCGGSGEGKSHGGETDAPDPCERCNGSGAEPPRSTDTERAGPHHDIIDAITYSGPERRAQPRETIGVDPAQPGGDYSPEQPKPPAVEPPPARTLLAGLGINL